MNDISLDLFAHQTSRFETFRGEFQFPGIPGCPTDVWIPFFSGFESGFPWISRDFRFPGFLGFPDIRFPNGFPGLQSDGSTDLG
jgi:hypothetical protein